MPAEIGKWPKSLNKHANDRFGLNTKMPEKARRVLQRKPPRLHDDVFESRLPQTHIPQILNIAKKKYE